MDDPNGVRGRAIVAQALDLGKYSGTTVTVLTGSSRRTRRYAFKYDVAELGRDAELETSNYPDLNNSAFKILSLEPLRTKAELQDALQTDDAMQLSDAFYRSGGVDRYFATDPPVAEWPADRIQQDLLTVMLARQSLLNFPPYGPATVNVEKVQALKDDPWNALVKVSDTQAHAVLGRAATAAAAVKAGEGFAGRDPPEKVAANIFLLMQEQHLIYCHYGVVTFLRPADAETLAVQCCRRMENEEGELTRACLLLLATKAGDCGNAGVRAERAILKYMVRSGGLGQDLLLGSPDGWQVLNNRLPSRTVFLGASSLGVTGFWLQDVGEFVFWAAGLSPHLLSPPSNLQTRRWPST